MIEKTVDVQVSEYLASIGVEYNSYLVGPTKRDDWECDAWQCSLNCKDVKFTSPYYTGTGHRVDTPATARLRASLKNVNRNSIAWQDMLKQMKPVKPSAASVLYSLITDGEAIDQSFTDWCDNFGYDEDSRKVYKMYEECCKTGKELRKLFTVTQRETLSNLLQDY